jgi:hypothetical protein
VSTIVRTCPEVPAAVHAGVPRDDPVRTAADVGLDHATPLVAAVEYVRTAPDVGIPRPNFARFSALTFLPVGVAPAAESTIYSMSSEDGAVFSV